MLQRKEIYISIHMHILEKRTICQNLKVNVGVRNINLKNFREKTGLEYKHGSMGTLSVVTDSLTSTFPQKHITFLHCHTFSHL